MTQKFHKGDHVQVAKDLGRSMRHFTNDCEAIVVGSYKDQFGGSDTKSYTLHLKDRGQCSWYEEHQLELIEAGRVDLLEKWEKEKEDECEKKSNLDWIFSNGQSVIESAHGATIAALAKCFGLENLWGSHGEGFVYYKNALFTLGLAKPFLEKNDKAGWLNFCSKLKV